MTPNIAANETFVASFISHSLTDSSKFPHSHLPHNQAIAAATRSASIVAAASAAAAGRVVISKTLAYVNAIVIPPYNKKLFLSLAVTFAGVVVLVVSVPMAVSASVASSTLPLTVSVASGTAAAP